MHCGFCFLGCGLRLRRIRWGEPENGLKLNLMPNSGLIPAIVVYTINNVPGKSLVFKSEYSHQNRECKTMMIVVEFLQDVFFGVGLC